MNVPFMKPAAPTPISILRGRATAWDATISAHAATRNDRTNVDFERIISSPGDENARR
jgi:hypothetical protein